MGSKGEKLVLEEEAMLEAINKAKEALAKMEKCYKRGKGKKDRDEAEEEKEPYNHGQRGGLAVVGIDEAPKEAGAEAELEAESKAEAEAEAEAQAEAEKGAPLKGSGSESGSEEESRENTEGWTSSMPPAYSD